MGHAMQHQDTAPIERVGLGEVWRWLAPWLLGAFLAGAAFLGFYAASRAQDDGTYILGFVTAGLAFLMLIWRVKLALDGRGSAAPVLVDEASALVIVIALLAILAVGGLVLAARGGAVMLQAVGYALFVFCLAFIFGNVKHYFDQRERGSRS
jgi:CDP-diglyceride synthetase